MAAAIVIASGGFMVFIVLLLAAAYVFMFQSKPKGSADDPYENEDPDEKVFVVDETTGARIEKRDCSGTSWIKKGECARDGKALDGTKELCGKGKVEWILDPSHKDFKPALGGGACPSQLRDCENPCPKPCEGDTWIKGACVRVHADGKETKLDGTAGKCGDGVLRETLDQKADDFKPAVGSGGCTFKRSGACHVKCPKPQPPKCSYPVLGWQNNDMGCVVSQTNHTKLKCGKKGVIQQFKASTINTNKCDQLTRWAACTMPACPVDCRGTWGKNDGWGKCVGQCDSQPQKERRYTITRTAKHGGKACPYENNKLEYKNCGKIVPCCETGQWSDWSACGADGKKTKKRSVKNCASNVASKESADCCYQKGDWKNSGSCSSGGKQKQTQTTKGCKKGTGTRYVNCCYQKGNWKNSGSCSGGKQKQTQTTKNCPAGKDSRKVDCCTWHECKDWSWDGDPCYYNRKGSISRMYWDNGMSSYELKGGCNNFEMRAYDHPNYKGSYFVMKGGGRKDVPGGWNDRVGSVLAVPK